MHTSTRYVYLFLTFFYTFHSIQAQSATATKKQPWLTILVHGVISVKPFLSPYNILILMQDDIQNSVYAHTIKHARQDPFFHQYHAMQELGLKKIDTTQITPGKGATAFARAYDQLSTHLHQNTNNIYYTYGWSALVSKKVWKHEANRFYHTLCKEIETYRKQGIEPKIRIIGYSHGGTIATHLAQAQKTSGDTVPINIDELILIGVPTAFEIAKSLKNPLFKKIYHIYSYGDRVQTFDIFSLNVLFSKHTFTDCARNPLNNKLHQIGLKMYRLSTTCQKKCPNGHPTYPGPPRHIRNVHPGHTELWSFDWAGSSYRSYLPIAPLPLATCIPWFTSLADTYSEDSHSITIEMHPYCNHTNIYCYKNGTTKQQPFITTSVLEAMQKDAACFCPPGSHSKKYEQHIQAAVHAAHKTIRIKKNYRPSRPSANQQLTHPKRTKRIKRSRRTVK